MKFKEIFNKNIKQYISFICIILFIIFCTNLITTIYNNTAYSKFHKIGEIQNTWQGNIESLILNDNSILLFCQNGTWGIGESNIFYDIYYINKDKVIKKKTRINAFMLKPVILYNDKVYLLYIENSKTVDKNGNYILEYDYKNDVLMDKKIKTFPYSLNTTTLRHNNKAIILNRYSAKKGKVQKFFITAFDPKTYKSEILQKYTTYKQIISIAPPAYYTEEQELNFVNINNVNYIAKIKNNNTEKIGMSLLNINNGKISDIDVKKINNNLNRPERMAAQKKVIWLKNNSFLVITYPVFGKHTFFDIYLLDDKDIILQNSLAYHNNGILKRNSISPNNYAVLNDNRVLFIGGYNGKADISWLNKECFLFEIKKNQIRRIGDFKYRIKNQRLIPLNKNVLLFGGYKKENIFTKQTLLKEVFMFNF